MGFKPQQWAVFNSYGMKIAFGTLEGKSQREQKRTLSALSVFRRMGLAAEDKTVLKLGFSDLLSGEVLLDRKDLAGQEKQDSVYMVLSLGGKDAHATRLRVVVLAEPNYDLDVFFGAKFAAPVLGQKALEYERNALSMLSMTPGVTACTGKSQRALRLQHRVRQGLRVIHSQSELSSSGIRVNVQYNGVYCTLKGESGHTLGLN